MNRAGARKNRLCAKNPSPVRLKRDFARFAVSKIEMKSQRATANAAERKRSRSEADTGRRIGASFGQRLFFGCENRKRFSRRAGPSMGMRFGLWIGLSCLTGFGARANSAIPREIAVLGKGDALAARGGAPRTNPTEKGRASAALRAAQFAAIPCGGLQLVGARCIHRWRRTFRDGARAILRIASSPFIPGGNATEYRDCD